MFKELTKNQEARGIRCTIIFFWMSFWFLNFIDKLIEEPVFLWVGKPRLSQFTDYWASIGLTDPFWGTATLIGSAIIEFIAFAFLAAALVQHFKKNAGQVRSWFAKGMMTGLGIFTFFTLGDQAFGDRVELLEHSIYFGLLLISWAVFTWLSDKRK